jgi:DNA-binding MarR family transcriptional regulator
MKSENENLFISDKTIGILIHRIEVNMKIEALQAFRANKCIVTPEQWGLLYLLSRKGEQYQRQISKATLKDRPNISRMIDILEKKELVKRKPDEENRRIFKVFLTDKGKEIAVKYMPLLKNIADNACQVLTGEEVEALQNILWKIYEHQILNLKIQI